MAFSRLHARDQGINITEKHRRWLPPSPKGCPITLGPHHVHQNIRRSFLREMENHILISLGCVCRQDTGRHWIRHSLPGSPHYMVLRHAVWGMIRLRETDQLPTTTLTFGSMRQYMLCNHCVDTNRSTPRHCNSPCLHHHQKTATSRPLGIMSTVRTDSGAEQPS